MGARDWEGRGGSERYGHEGWMGGPGSVSRQIWGSGMQAVPSFRGRGPKGYKRSDDRIREDVCDLLTDHDEVDASNIEVKVQNGEVTLVGTVTERRAKHMAEHLAESIPGVVDIHNQLRVKREEGTMQTTGLADRNGIPQETRGQEGRRGMSA